MSSKPSFLLQNATILVPRGLDDDTVVPLKQHSLLVEGNRIARIAAHIDPPSSSTEIIDCTAKILCPGFIDTHHHVWQTQLKGRHADHTLLEYMAPGNMASYSHTPENIFWGQLGGCLEALHAGTTTVVDHAHLGYSSSHNWLSPQLEMLCKASPFGDGRVTMGFAFDLFFLPKEIVVDLFTAARKLGVRTITSHCVPSHFGASTVDLLEQYGLLQPDILLSHATPLSAADAEKLQRAQAAISSTPHTELQMGHGWPVCFQDNARTISSLGVDCHSNNTASMVDQMRVALQAERARRNGEALESGKIPARVSISVQDSFQLGTIKGARAIKMADRLGTLEEGKMADIIIYDKLSPGMVCAAEEDPIGAIILHSSVADIDAVIVDGQFRKRNGRLKSIKLDLALAPEIKPEKIEMEWRDVALELLKGRERIQEAEKRTGADDREAAQRSAIQLLGVKEERLAL